MDPVRQDLTEIKVILGRHEVILERNSADLADHMQRTLLLERFQARWAGAFMVLSALATLLGAIAAAVKVAEFFR